MCFRVQVHLAMCALLRQNQHIFVKLAAVAVVGNLAAHSVVGEPCPDYPLHGPHRRILVEVGLECQVSLSPFSLSLSHCASGARYGYVLSPVLRLVPATGIFFILSPHWWGWSAS